MLFSKQNIQVIALSPVLISLVLILSICSSTSYGTTLDNSNNWMPVDDVRWDWLQTNSGEWLKGELITLYDKEIEFDSDEFGVVSIDWKDVAFLRTAQTKGLRFTDGKIVVGRILMQNQTVNLMGSETLFDSKLLISIVANNNDEWNYWDNEFELGLDLHSGNTDGQSYSASLEMQRQTSLSRLRIDYRGLYSESSNIQSANNHRFNISMDWFFSHRAFFSPLNFEFFRDPFQNIAQRYVYSAQIGYYMIDDQELYWEVSAGPGYQNTEFDQVEAGENSNISTEILELDTELEWDISKDIEYDLLYTARWVDRDSGGLIHHFESGFDFDITGELEFRVRFIIDRIAEPTPDEEGELPEKTDRRLLFGLVFEF